MFSKQHREESILVDTQALDRVWEIIAQRHIEPNPEVFEKLVRTALEQEQAENRLAEWTRAYFGLRGSPHPYPKPLPESRSGRLPPYNRTGRLAKGLKVEPPDER